MEKDETHRRNATELREREALRDVNERKNTAGGWEIGWRSRQQGWKGGQRGTVETEGRTKYTTTFAFCARDAARGRDAPINRCAATSVVALSSSSSSTLVAFTISLHPFLPPRRRLRYIREGGIIEIARRRVHQTGKGRERVGSTEIREPPATDQRRPCARFLIPLVSHPFDRIRALSSNYPCLSRSPLSEVLEREKDTTPLARLLAPLMILSKVDFFDV